MLPLWEVVKLQDNRTKSILLGLNQVRNSEKMPTLTKTHRLLPNCAW
jgi:hypothetical protein